MYRHQYFGGNLFDLNTYKDKSYIKMMGYPWELITTITTSIFDENDMAAHGIWFDFSPADDRTQWQLCQPKRLLTLAGMTVNKTKTALSENILLRRTLIQLRVRRHLIVAVTYFNRTPHLIWFDFEIVYLLYPLTTNSWCIFKAICVLNGML